MAEGENGFSVPEIELIIKASTIDGRRKGACIFCQEYFMDLYLLAGTLYYNLYSIHLAADTFNLHHFLIAELKTISLKITTVDMKRPPADFRSFSKIIQNLSQFCDALSSRNSHNMVQVKSTQPRFG